MKIKSHKHRLCPGVLDLLSSIGKKKKKKKVCKNHLFCLALRALLDSWMFWLKSQTADKHEHTNSD